MVINPQFSSAAPLTEVRCIKAESAKIKPVIAAVMALVSLESVCTQVASVVMSFMSSHTGISLGAPSVTEFQ